MIKKENVESKDLNLCATCKNCKFGVKLDKDGNVLSPEIITYECDDYSEQHTTELKECPHYSPYKNFFWLCFNSAWGFLGLTIIAVLIIAIVLIIKLM